MYVCIIYVILQICLVYYSLVYVFFSHGIKVLRKTLAEISLEGHLNDSRGLFM